jgi:hypothetical protein
LPGYANLAQHLVNSTDTGAMHSLDAFFRFGAFARVVL